MSIKVNQSAVVTAVDTNEDGSTTVTLTSRKVDNGVPSFHVAYTYPAGSTAAERYPLDTVWVAAIEINAPAQDQITSTASLSSASGVTEQPGEPSTGIVPEAPSEATEAPAAPAEAPTGIVDPTTGQFVAGETFATPASDVPEATIDAEHPAVADPNLANLGIDQVKSQLGIT